MPNFTKASNIADQAMTSDYTSDKIDFADLEIFSLQAIWSSADNLTGAFSFSSTGAAAATVTKIQDGQDPTDTWAYQSSWNVDPMDGSGPSGHILDPTILNLYRISFAYLGAGSISYQVYVPKKKEYFDCHIVYPGEDNTNLSNPYFKLGWFAASLGSSGTNMITKGGSAYGENIGSRGSVRDPRGFYSTKTGIGTANFINVLTIRCRRVFQGRVNLLEALMERVSIAVEGTKPAQVIVVLNATLGGEPNWTFLNEDDSIIEYDTAGTTVTIGASSQIILADSLSKDGSRSDDLVDLSVRIVPLETITIAVRATA